MRIFRNFYFSIIILILTAGVAIKVAEEYAEGWVAKGIIVVVPVALVTLFFSILMARRKIKTNDK